MKKTKPKITVFDENIVPSQMSDVLIGAFNRYAKAVITDRAIPDVRDGLKPVQRRIIFDMYSQGQVSTKPTVKCATIVGHVMGHFHPHGDSSIYDALVHLSQSWKMEAPLIDFQGNNGSIDDDPAAAYRYTEARLSRLCDFLTMDIDKDTVEMIPTFDDKSLEPTVLPCKFPNLLVNGTNGIAVGSTTYIPPHNLHEVVQATIYRISHARATLDNLMEFIPGPDFPTGGIIDDKEAIRSLYETGHGSFYLYCKSEIDEEQNTIIIKEIPYGVVKIDFVANLNKRKDTDNLDNIEEIVDESAKDDIEIVIKIKKGASPFDILSYLQTKGVLRTTMGCNFLAIDRGHPKTMSLLEMVDAYIFHQREMFTKAAKFDLKTDEDRLEIVAGLIKAYSIVDELIGKIKKCSGKEGVKVMLKTDYLFTERQAEAIAMLPLYRLSNTDIVALKGEQEQLNADKDRLNSILTNPDKLDHEIVSTLKEIDKQFSCSRKTEILDEKQDFKAVDQTKLIAKEDCYVAITKDGYVKRSSPKSFSSSAEANKKTDPVNLPKMKLSDSLVFSGFASTHDNILFFTNKGNFGYLPIYLISDMKWKEEGKHLNNLITLKQNEKIIKAFLINEFKPGVNVVILTSQNKIKRTALVDFAQTTITRKTLRACKLMNDDDKVVDVELTSGNSDVVVVDSLGRASRFNESYIPLVSTSALGVKAMATGIDKEPMISLLSFNSTEATLMLILAKKRAARVISSAKLEATERLGAKVSLVRIFKKNPMVLVSVTKVEKKRGQVSFSSAVTANSNVVIELTNLAPVELNSEMRENLPGLQDQELVSLNDFGEVLDDSFLIETPKPSKTVPSKAKEDKADTQLSLFDLFEKENSKK
ncbi:MAG: DNA topoisomerase (ATP-hydrolyzing) subunit A [Bacilli bacterium]